MKRNLPFTVICFDEDTRQINCFHVHATEPIKAFAAAVKQHPSRDLSFVVALPGHQSEGDALTFPGEGLVCAETVREQPDVFGKV